VGVFAVVLDRVAHGRVARGGPDRDAVFARRGGVARLSGISWVVGREVSRDLRLSDRRNPHGFRSRGVPRVIAHLRAAPPR
jgi:hypothetical protein